MPKHEPRQMADAMLARVRGKREVEAKIVINNLYDWEAVTGDIYAVYVQAESMPEPKKAVIDILKFPLEYKINGMPVYIRMQDSGEYLITGANGPRLLRAFGAQPNLLGEILGNMTNRPHDHTGGSNGPQVPINTGTSGTLNVNRGGTGRGSLTANSLLAGNGTSAVDEIAPGSNGNILQSNGTSWASVAPGFITSLSLAGDTGSAQPLTNGNTAKVAGGVGTNTVASATDTVTVNLDIPKLTADATPDGATDYVVTYDASDSAHKKVLLNDLPGGGGGGSMDDFNISGDTGTGTITDAETLGHIGGAAMTSAVSGNNVTYRLNVAKESTVTAATGDLLPIADVSDSNNIKNITVGDARGTAAQHPYTPADTSKWPGTDPDDSAEAHDKLADRVTTLEAGATSGTPIIKTTITMEVKEVLYDTTLSSNGRFDVSSISQSYDHLVMRLFARSSVTGAGGNADDMLLYFNNDTTAYRVQRSAGNNGTANVAQAANSAIFGVPGSGTGNLANSFSDIEIRIPYYSTTAYLKTAFATGNQGYGAALMLTGTGGIAWDVTDAITRVQLQPDGYSTDNFVTGSRLVIFGVKNMAMPSDVTGGGNSDSQVSGTLTSASAADVATITIPENTAWRIEWDFVLAKNDHTAMSGGDGVIKVRRATGGNVTQTGSTTLNYDEDGTGTPRIDVTTTTTEVKLQGYGVNSETWPYKVNYRAIQV